MSIFPDAQGLLPKWLFLIGVVSAYNVVQCYSSVWGSQRVYSNAPSSVTPLSARTFGTWTALSAYIRICAAFNIHNPIAYQLAFATFVVAWLHFFTEWMIFRTAKLGAGLAGPAVVASASVLWMLNSWNHYIGQA